MLKQAFRRLRSILTQPNVENVGRAAALEIVVIVWSGCVASQFFLDFGQQLVDHLRGVDPHEPAKEAPTLPSNGKLGRIREPVHAGDADPHMPLCFRTRNSGDVAPDVRLG
jgi:hypothetical protein